MVGRGILKVYLIKGEVFARYRPKEQMLKTPING